MLPWSNHRLNLRVEFGKTAANAQIVSEGTLKLPASKVF